MGNPLYDWEYHKKTGYDWWIRRIEHCFRLYDVVRIDHFRGFDEYYAVPYGEKTAVHGKWMPGPGIELFRTLEEKIGRKRIIAEDLGCHMDDVNVKATTTEKLGFTGRGEGIACEAVALLIKATK